MFGPNPITFNSTRFSAPVISDKVVTRNGSIAGTAMGSLEFQDKNTSDSVDIRFEFEVPIISD